MITFPFVVNAHSGLHRESNEKVWQLENSKTSFRGNLILVLPCPKPDHVILTEELRTIT